jgi:O-antigen/teichoic acid export membrane protein
VGKVTGRLLSIAGDIFAARILGVALFGLYSIGWTLLRIIGTVAPLGFAVGVIKYVPQYLGKDLAKLKGLLISSIIVSVTSGIMIGGVFYALAPWLADYIYEKPDLIVIFRMYAFAFPLISLLSVTSAISRSTRRMTFSVILEDVGQPLVGLIFVVLIYLVMGRWLPGVILSDIISYAIPGLLGLVVVRRMFSAVFTSSSLPDYSIIRNVLTFSIPTSLANVFSIFVFWVDRLIAGVLLLAAENGIYQVASQLSTIFAILLAAFNAISSPIFAELFAKGEILRLEEVYRVGTKWSFYISLFPFTMLMLFPTEILVVLFGADYSLGKTALMILAAGQLVNSATGSVGPLLVMTGHQKTWLWLSASGLIANVILCFALIPPFGITGAAIGTSITVGGMNLLAIFLSKRYLNIWPYDRRYLKGLAAGLAASLAISVFKFISLPPLLILGASALSFLFIFFMVLYMLHLDAEDFLLFSLIEDRLGIKFSFLEDKTR